MRFDLSDEEWAVLEPLMPTARTTAPADDRTIMNAIFYVLRTGIGESGATRTPFPAQGGQQSGDCGQQVMAA